MSPILLTLWYLEHVWSTDLFVTKYFSVQIKQSLGLETMEMVLKMPRPTNSISIINKYSIMSDDPSLLQTQQWE